MSCFILTEFARILYLNKEKKNKSNIKRAAFEGMKNEIASIKDNLPFNPRFFAKFGYIFEGNLSELDEDT
jgi:hypothetical protein